MDILQIIGFVCIAILFTASTWFILWCDYDDGIVGKLGLICISLGCLVRLIELTEDDPFEFSGVSILVLVGMATFMLRHWYRAAKHLSVKTKSLT